MSCLLGVGQTASGDILGEQGQTDPSQKSHMIYKQTLSLTNLFSPPNIWAKKGEGKEHNAWKRRLKHVIST